MAIFDVKESQLKEIGITAGLVTLLIVAFYGTGLYLNIKKIKDADKK